MTWRETSPMEERIRFVNADRARLRKSQLPGPTGARRHRRRRRAPGVRAFVPGSGPAAADRTREPRAKGRPRTASRWNASPRAYPEPLPNPDYPARYLKRLVSSAGTFFFPHQLTHPRSALAGEWVGLDDRAPALEGVPGPGFTSSSALHTLFPPLPGTSATDTNLRRAGFMRCAVECRPGGLHERLARRVSAGRALSTGHRRCERHRCCQRGAARLRRAHASPSRTSMQPEPRRWRTASRSAAVSPASHSATSRGEKRWTLSWRARMRSSGASMCCATWQACRVMVRSRASPRTSSTGSSAST